MGVSWVAEFENATRFSINHDSCRKFDFPFFQGASATFPNILNEVLEQVFFGGIRFRNASQIYNPIPIWVLKFNSLN